MIRPKSLGIYGTTAGKLDLSTMLNNSCETTLTCNIYGIYGNADTDIRELENSDIRYISWYIIIHTYIFYQLNLATK